MPKQATRAERFNEAQGIISDGKRILEELRDELQNWLDNMPENLQNGSKAEQLQTAIDELDSGIEGLEQAENISPEFPGIRS